MGSKYRFRKPIVSERKQVEEALEIIRKHGGIIKGDNGSAGITEEAYEHLIDAGVIEKAGMEESGKTLHIPREECERMPGATVVDEYGEGQAVCLIRVYQRPDDPDTAIVKKLKLRD